MSQVLNINVGFMGHVDSGKTSLSKCLSDIGSTAAFDKHPQSQERGITLDLGFSSFKADLPSHLHRTNKNTLQVTLVDCPGHASLFKTVIGGSKIIDMILLVIDITHGIQVQTAECILLAEILARPVLVALNKVDRLDKNVRDHLVLQEKMKISKILSKTALKIINIVSVSAALSSSSDEDLKYHPNVLKTALIESCSIPIRSESGPFLFAVDHCFGIKGTGTIVTGTVISGALRINDEIMLIDQRVVKEVKSIQVFKQGVDKISQGDRAGLSIGRFDSKLLERGLVCSSKDQVKFISAAIIDLQIVKHFKKDIKSYSKISVSIGFDVMTSSIVLLENNEWDTEKEFSFLESINLTSKTRKCFCFIKFERPIFYMEDSVVIGIKLSRDPTKNICRIMFHGYVHRFFENDSDINFKVYGWRDKTGIVDRGTSDYVIVKNMFNPSVNIDKYIGGKIEFSTGDSGILVSRFGATGKIKVGVKIDEISECLKKAFDKKNKEKTENIIASHRYKKYRKFC
ncbi:hypothetical protein HZS_2729 [Henneguya salminicola]|nr:hypothetical protein HZS_2729 [Henneguya salminicola]